MAVQMKNTALFRWLQSKNINPIKQHAPPNDAVNQIQIHRNSKQLLKLQFTKIKLKMKNHISVDLHTTNDPKIQNLPHKLHIFVT